MEDKRVATTLRLPPGMATELQEWAEEHRGAGRVSRNEAIVQLLRKALDAAARRKP